MGFVVMRLERSAVATQLHGLRNQALQRMEAQDDRFSRSQPVVLKKNSQEKSEAAFSKTVAHCSTQRTLRTTE